MQAFGAYDLETAAIESPSSAARLAELRAVAIQARLTLLIEVAGAIAGLLVLGVGALEMHAGNLTVGSLIAFLGCLSVRCTRRSAVWPKPQPGFNALPLERNAFSICSVPPSLVTERRTAKPLAHIRGALEFSNVHFAYAGGPEVSCTTSRFALSQEKQWLLWDPMGAVNRL